MASTQGKTFEEAAEPESWWDRKVKIPFTSYKVSLKYALGAFGGSCLGLGWLTGYFSSSSTDPKALSPSNYYVLTDKDNDAKTPLGQLKNLCHKNLGAAAAAVAIPSALIGSSIAYACRSKSEKDSELNPLGEGQTQGSTLRSGNSETPDSEELFSESWWDKYMVWVLAGVFALVVFGLVSCLLCRGSKQKIYRGPLDVPRPVAQPKVGALQFAKRFQKFKSQRASTRDQKAYNI